MPSKKWLRQRRPSDKLIEDGRDSDCVIVIMGPTGVGKSTFMNHVAGTTVTAVGHNLASCTQNTQWHTIDNPKAAGFELEQGRRLILVDTPGFNDTYLDDSEILRRIAVWLAGSYAKGMKLGGIIYLYDISAKRLTGSARLNLKMFEKLCGSKAYDRVVIGTTKWSTKTAEDQASQYRLAELKKEYWAPLLNNGAREHRVDNNRQSCINIVNSVLAAPSNRAKEQSLIRTLKIQQELVDQEKLVPRTEAGKTLNFTMKDMLKAKKEEYGEARDAEQKRKIQEDIDWLKGQIGELNTGFFQRLKWRLLP